ncbi:indigoidine synthase A-like protein [Punctularia strigosozonata HHB-11173 SS5]|uniref:indigoidine synthase A-like protein n=1 Tax=Punctularia strigosozonata (strain HHB-11173) TaxID=741275 RepID=UPI0004416BFA|nr:indigoidine synthase A-like protein [Punctularia strigosozonata HHB-11173 SS5]EIN13804.1 indigoidine synthase A-like protein [Punctularia strigosozonata HHB-11173 SS5]
MLQFATRRVPASVLRLRGAFASSIAGPGLPSFVDVHPEVQDALAHNRPLVALETTIVTHGMPQPTNLETARSVERIVRSTGSVPATIGVISGRVKIGLEPAELEYLADVKQNSGVVKLSRRDIGPAIAMKRDGGTTCSTTLIFAALAGIKNCNGRLGGVHRGGENSMDVSADLHELTRCPVGLVSAGVKSILDIGRTLEYLETLGVPVLTYGENNEFPAFYSPQSGFKSAWSVNDPYTAARILHSQAALNMTTGALFAAPIPSAYHGVGAELQAAVEQAVRESEENGMSKRGKEVTPWLLARVGDLTRGKSLASNVALIENTAKIGGQIAAAYSQLVGGTETSFTGSAKLAVVGSAAVDITARPRSDSEVALGTHSTAPGMVNISLGGVARNMAEAAHRVITSRAPQETSATALICGIGHDSFGRLIKDETQLLGMRTDAFVQSDQSRSAVCNMLLDVHGGLMSGIADMDITEQLTGEQVLQELQRLRPCVVALDANLAPSTLDAVIRYCQREGITCTEPTSVPKSTRILPGIATSLSRCAASGPSPVSFASPNLLELVHLYAAARADSPELTSHNYWWDAVHSFKIGGEFRMDLEHLARRNVTEEDSSKGTLSFLVEKGIGQMAINMLPFFGGLVIKCGDKGIIVAMRIRGRTAWSSERTNLAGRYVVAHGDDSVVVLKHCPGIVVPPESIVNVTGCGDSLVGSLLADLAMNPAVLNDPDGLEGTISRAQRAAVLTLQSVYAVSPKL